MSNTIEHIEIKPGLTVSSRMRHYTEPWRSRTAKSRIYPWIKGESILQNLVDRTSRPAAEWGKVVRREVLPALGIEGTIRWSQKAGCSCPCSPGWIFNGHIEAPEGSDHQATNAPLVVGHGSLLARDLWVTFDLDVMGIPAYVKTVEREVRAANLGLDSPETV